MTLSATTRRISGTFLTNILLYALAAATGPLIARLLGPDGRGALAAIQLWPGAIATFAMLGLPDSLVFFAARYPDRADRWLTTAVLIGLATSLVGVCVGYVLINIGLRGDNERLIHPAHVYLLFIPLSALVGLPCQFVRGLGRFGLWNVLRVMPAAGWLIALLAATILGNRSPDALSASYLSFIVFEAFVIIVVWLTTSERPKTVTRGDAAALLRYGIPSGLSAVPQVLNLRLDQMLIAAILPSRDLGLYVVAVSWSAISGIALNAAGPIVSQRLAAERNTAVARRMFGQVTRSSVIVSAIMAAGFASLTPYAIRILYGAAFQEAIPIAIVLSAANAFVMVNTVLEEGLRGLDDTPTILRCELVGLVVTAVALAVLLSPLGILGAAVASVAGYSAVTIALGLSLRRHEMTFGTAFWPRGEDLRYVIAVVTASWNQVRGLGARAV